MLHKQIVTIVSSGSGEKVYVVFYNGVGYLRSRSSWRKKPVTLSDNTDYYDMLIEMAVKAA